MIDFNIQISELHIIIEWCAEIFSNSNQPSNFNIKFQSVWINYVLTRDYKRKVFFSFSIRTKTKFLVLFVRIQKIPYSWTKMK